MTQIFEWDNENKFEKIKNYIDFYSSQLKSL